MLRFFAVGVVLAAGLPALAQEPPALEGATVDWNLTTHRGGAESESVARARALYKDKKEAELVSFLKSAGREMTTSPAPTASGGPSASPKDKEARVLAYLAQVEPLLGVKFDSWGHVSLADEHLGSLVLAAVVAFPEAFEPLRTQSLPWEYWRYEHQVTRHAGDWTFVRYSPLVADLDGFCACVLPQANSSVLEQVVAAALRETPATAPPWAAEALGFAEPFPGADAAAPKLLPSLKSIQPPTFGSGLLRVLIEDGSARNVYGYVGERLKAIRALPAPRQRDLFRALDLILQRSARAEAAPLAGKAREAWALAQEILKADGRREAEAFLVEPAPPPGTPFDNFAYARRAGQLLAILAETQPALADKVLHQAVKTVEAQRAAGAPGFSFNSAEAAILKIAAEKCHSLGGLPYIVGRLAKAGSQQELGFFEEVSRTFSPVLRQAMTVRLAEKRAARGAPEARGVDLAEVLAEWDRMFGGAPAPGLRECLSAVAGKEGGKPLDEAERTALAARIAPLPRSEFLDAVRYDLEAEAAGADVPIDTPLPPSPESLASYRRLLEDESLAPLWRASIYWYQYNLRRLVRTRVAMIHPDSDAADPEFAPARTLMVKAAALAATAAPRMERRVVALLLDELNAAPVTPEWKAAAAPLVQAWMAAAKEDLRRRQNQDPPDLHIDQYERSLALVVLESCLKLEDRAAAEWLLAQAAFQLGRWPETYGVLAESPWPDLVSRTLAANAKDLELVAWYPTGGAPSRMRMTAARRQAADRLIQALTPPDVAHLAEALYAAMPAIGPLKEGRYGFSSHPTFIYQDRLNRVAEEFPALKFKDPALREASLELLLARPTWWRLKDELFAWGAGQKPADVCRAADRRDLSGGRVMEQYAACLVLLANDGKADQAMKALESIQAEAAVPNRSGPRELLDCIRESLRGLLTVQPESFYRAVPAPLARPAADYIELGKALCLNGDPHSDNLRSLGEAVMALYAAAGRPEEMAKFSEAFAAGKTGRRDPGNDARGPVAPLGVDLSVCERLLQGLPADKHVEAVGQWYAAIDKAGLNARAVFLEFDRSRVKGPPLPLLTEALKKWRATRPEPSKP
jgi:hypothetical protein